MTSAENDAKVINEDMERLIAEGALNIEDFRSKSFLVTGATGFMFNYIAKLMITLNKTFNLNMKIHLHGRSEKRIFERFDKDCFDENVKPAIFPLEEPLPKDLRTDYVIHGASPASTGAFLKNPVEVIVPNVFGIKNILEHAKDTGAKLLFISSTGICGNLDHIDKPLLSETDLGVTNPLSERACYQESKKLGEAMCHAYSTEYDVKTSIARPTYSYGPTFDLSSDTRIIPRTLKTILAAPESGGKISLFDDPRPLQYSYAGDVATGIFTILFKGENGSAYNICGDDMMSLQDMVQILIDSSGKNIKLELKKSAEDYYFKDSAVVRPMANAKLKALGYKECFGYDYGLRQTLRGYGDF